MDTVVAALALAYFWGRGGGEQGGGGTGLVGDQQGESTKVDGTKVDGTKVNLEVDTVYIFVPKTMSFEPVCKECNTSKIDSKHHTFKSETEYRKYALVDHNMFILSQRAGFAKYESMKQKVHSNCAIGSRS